MSLLDEIKMSLGGINHTKLDVDISQTIRAACMDLERIGIQSADDVAEIDPLVCQAVKLYCRGFYNYQGQGENWQKAYDSLRNSLSLDPVYSGRGGRG